VSGGFDTLTVGAGGATPFPGPGALRYGGARPLPASGNDRPAERMETNTATVAPPPTDRDADLLRDAAGGDRNAFHALVERHSDGLFRLAVSLSRNRADAEDVLQETFVGAYRGLSKFNGHAAVKTWLTQILIRQAAKMWNKSKRSREAVAIDSPAGEAAGEALSRPSSEADVDRRLDLMQVIDGLPEDHRQVILLREVQGLSYEEIAQVLGVPRGTVESRLHRARSRLKQRLKGYAA